MRDAADELDRGGRIGPTYLRSMPQPMKTTGHYARIALSKFPILAFNQVGKPAILDAFSDAHVGDSRLPSYSSVTTIMAGFIVAASAITNGSALDLPFTVSTSRGWFPMIRLRWV